MSGSIDAFDDDIRLLECMIGIAFDDIDVLERQRRLLGIEQRLLFVIADDHARRVELFLVFVRNEQDWLRHVLHFMLGQERLVMRHEIDSVLCGNVAIVDDGESCRVEVE